MNNFIIDDRKINNQLRARRRGRLNEAREFTRRRDEVVQLAVENMRLVWHLRRAFRNRVQQFLDGPYGNVPLPRDIMTHYNNRPQPPQILPQDDPQGMYLVDMNQYLYAMTSIIF